MLVCSIWGLGLGLALYPSIGYTGNWLATQFAWNLAILGSVPDTPCPVVGGALLPCCLHLFYRVVQEKVDQDGVCVGLGVLSADLPANQLHAPYAASW